MGAWAIFVIWCNDFPLQKCYTFAEQMLNPPFQRLSVWIKSNVLIVKLSGLAAT